MDNREKRIKTIAISHHFSYTLPQLQTFWQGICLPADRAQLPHVADQPRTEGSARTDCIRVEKVLKIRYGRVAQLVRAGVS